VGGTLQDGLTEVSNVLLYLALSVLGLYVAITGLLYLFHPALVYHPWREHVTNPGHHGLPYEDVSFVAGDGMWRDSTRSFGRQYGEGPVYLPILRLKRWPLPSPSRSGI